MSGHGALISTDQKTRSECHVSLVHHRSACRKRQRQILQHKTRQRSAPPAADVAPAPDPAAEVAPAPVPPADAVPRKRRKLPASFSAVKRNPEVPSDVWSMLTYSDQARMAAAAHVYRARMEVLFKDMAFSQHDHYWKFKDKKKSKTRVSSTCTAIACLSAMDFYLNPDLMFAAWNSDELWIDLHKRGAALHKPLMTKFWLGDAALRVVLGPDVWFVRPDEIVVFLVKLALSDAAFAPLRSFHAKRSMYALTAK